MQYFALTATANQKIEEYVSKNKYSLKLRNSLITAYLKIMNFINKDGRSVNRIRQKLIAQILGFSREWTCKLIGHLEKAGVLNKIKPDKNSLIHKLYDNYFWYELPEQSKLNEYFETKKAKDKVKSIQNNTKNNFMNYNGQRQYDIEKLEKQLLGRDDDSQNVELIWNFLGYRKRQPFCAVENQIVKYYNFYFLYINGIYLFKIHIYGEVKFRY